MPGAEDQVSVESVVSILPSPDSLTKLVKRLRSLIWELLPEQVDPDSINDPTSRIITPAVIKAFRSAAGDFQEALPYCLLRARAEFMWDANHNIADYDENLCRARACETLARRIVHLLPEDILYAVMSTRYQRLLPDGDVSEMSSALELAIDNHCTIFLSSSEAQDVVNALWDGKLIQKNNDNHDIDYVLYEETREPGFLSHINPARMSVPRYQNWFRIAVWLVFLVVYSQAVREPLDRMNSRHPAIDGWELILYFMAFAFCVEDFSSFMKLLRFVSWRAFSFWNAVAFVTDSLLLSAFILRVGDLFTPPERTDMRLKSFQLLSFVAPLIWMKFVTICDGYKYVGTMQICVARMLKESGIFIVLLTVLGLGFGQGLYALDAADGETESPSAIINVLVQALFGSPNFEKFEATFPGLVLYYLWNLATTVILLNVLISLFSSAYADVVDDAEAQYLAFFAGKTVGMIRAPDSYVYPSPFNLIEVFFVIPFEAIPKLALSRKKYAKLNRFVMIVVFFVPLSFIALYESQIQHSKNRYIKNWFRGVNEGDIDDELNHDPEVIGHDADNGLKISKVSFEDIVKQFPNTKESSEASTSRQIADLKKQIADLTKLIQQNFPQLPEK